MERKKLIIIGAGGHGKVLADIVCAQDHYHLVGFVDASLPVGTSVITEFKVVESQDRIDFLKSDIDCFIVAIGNNIIRERVYNQLSSLFEPAVIIHPSSIIGSDVIIGKGTVVLPNSVINASSIIGENCLINTGVIIDHDCEIGNHVHFGVGSLIGSNSCIESFRTTTVGEIVSPFSTFDSNE